MNREPMTQENGLPIVRVSETIIVRECTDGGVRIWAEDDEWFIDLYEKSEVEGLIAFLQDWMKRAKP